MHLTIGGKVRWSKAGYAAMQGLPEEFTLQIRNHIRDLATVFCRNDGGKEVLGSHVHEAVNALTGGEESENVAQQKPPIGFERS